MIILYPGIKIAAAGLYTAATAEYLFQTRSVSVDTSLPDHFEFAYALGTAAAAGITDRASQWSEWSQIKDYGLPPRMGTLNNVVISTIDTGLTNIASISTVVPAIEVDVHCSAHDTGDFNPMGNSRGEAALGLHGSLDVSTPGRQISMSRVCRALITTR